MISAIVLAAGKSTRMGEENKMLLPFNKSTVIGTVVNALQQSLVDEIIIVESGISELKNHIENSSALEFVTNTNADQGLTSSIQCGVQRTKPKSPGYLICLGDMPLLTKDDYNLLINRFLEINNKVILVPSSSNNRGNPVLFSHHFRENILQLQHNTGCKPILLANPDMVIEVPVLNNNYYIDIDTIEEYNRLVD